MEEFLLPSAASEAFVASFALLMDSGAEWRPPELSRMAVWCAGTCKKHASLSAPPAPTTTSCAPSADAAQACATKILASKVATKSPERSLAVCTAATKTMAPRAMACPAGNVGSLVRGVTPVETRDMDVVSRFEANRAARA